MTTGNTVECWGSNQSGQLGAGTGPTGSSNAPLAISPFTSTWISSGGSHVCSLDDAGVTACWGSNFNGQIGHGHAGTVPTSNVVPAPVPRFGVEMRRVGGASPPSRLSNSLPQRRPLEEIVVVTFSQLAVGGDHNCVLDANGHAYCWGLDTSGQIGNGPRIAAMCHGFACVTAPTIVLPSTGVMFNQITAGGAYNCAADNGIVYCWGFNGFGQLGTGAMSFQPQRVPARIKIPPISKPPVVLTRSMIETSAKSNNTCAVDSFGEFFCWGSLVSSATPKQITGPAGLTQPLVKAQAGDSFACTAAAGAVPACFGANNFGQLGDGTNLPEATAVMMASPAMSTFSLGSDFGCGIDTAAGDLKCWGRNDTGQLGDGTMTPSSVPVTVQGSGSFGAVDVGAGQTQACAISAAGAVFCWGGKPVPFSIAGGWKLP